MTIRRTVAALLALCTLPLALASAASAAPTGTESRRALLIYPTWDTGSGTPAAPVDKSMDEVATAVGPAARTWFWEVSHQQFPGWQVQSVGPVTVAPPTMDTGGKCGPTFRDTVSKNADAAARARGLDPASFHNVVYYFSKLPCGWSGFAFDRLVWLNGDTSVGTVVQELGHTLGLEHGFGLQCRDGAGNPVALSGSCALLDRADPFTAMSSGSGSFSAVQQDDLGWMAGRMQTASTTGGTYTVAPIEQVAPATQVLRVPDGNGTLWFEYRRPIGVDASMPSGMPVVLVHRTTAETGRKSVLLDMRPGTTMGFFDAGMAAGMSFTSPNTGFVITVKSTGDTGAQVEVRVPTRTVPNVVDMTKSTATSKLQQAGFVVRAAGQLDETCERVGLVMRQSPAAGTVHPVGTAVTIYVGTAPRTGCP